AALWYLNMRQEYGQQPWNWWKEQILSKFDTPAWSWKMQTLFEKDYFKPGTDNVQKWKTRQRQRLMAFAPNSTPYRIKQKILRQCGGNLAHSIKSRCNDTTSIEDIASAMEEIITTTNIWKGQNTNLERYSSQKLLPKLITDTKTVKTEDKDKVCYNCKKPGHLANACNVKRKYVNAF
ncbi:hypothetical protein BY996DRAFT_4594368, partial [Phakopsora pachyrhizi]